MSILPDVTRRNQQILVFLFELAWVHDFLEHHLEIFGWSLFHLHVFLILDDLQDGAIIWNP